MIGVKKSGTYALLRYLSINPQVKAALKMNGCNTNEIHFFDKDINYLKGLDWYLKQMPIMQNQSNLSNSSDRYLVIEKTPGYFR